MMNLNDTISAFRCCTQIPPMCKECPLTEMCKWNLSKDRCKNEVKLSVNHWLQAQEPRVMTLWEAVGIIDRPVYLERNVLMPDKSVNRQECWALVCATDDEHMIRLATPYGEEKWHVGAYGIGWRCWTSRPTEAEREAIPWV